MLMILEALLKDIVDETSCGKYDFMYLRIGMKPLYIYVSLTCNT